MTVLSHVIRRSVVPIGLSLAVIAVLLIALSVVPARATPETFDRSISNAPQLPNVPLSIPALPAGVPAPSLDGDCGANEWGSATVQTFTDVGGVSSMVRLLHDGSNLYVCMQAAKGSNNSRFASVYLDTDNSQDAFAGANDYSLRINIITGTTSAYYGTGVANGYVPTPLTGWTAVSSFSAGDVAEYKIGNALTGGACGLPFRLAVYHHWVGFTGNDFGWPSNQWFDQPATWKEVQLAGASCKSGNVLYVYRYDTATAADFKSLLERAGYTVDLKPVSAITTTAVISYDLIIVADDTGSLNTWSGSAADVTKLAASLKPIIGLGEGGYAFFGKVSSPIGWPHGWHGPQDKVIDTGQVPSYYLNPNDLSGLLPGPFPIYSAPSNEVGIYMTTAPASVTPIAWEPYHAPTGAYDHASLTLDGCYHLWGFSDGPTDMNGLGQLLFVNAAQYMRRFQCPQPPQPPPDCLTLVKTAAPPNGSVVHPGDSISYTLSYTVTNNDQCATLRSLLFDPVPDHTLFIPGSAGPGVVPTFDGTLQWNLGPLNAGAHGSRSFKVSVLDTACRLGVITNTAKLQTNIGTFTSNATTHKLDCPPVVPPNNDPPYAESEIQVYPYPLVTGQPTKLSVRVFNTSAASQTVTVTFMTSANRFGIGIPFGALPVPGNPRVLTVGGLGYAEVALDWIPISSGHYCLMVKIESAGYAPIYTYRNLDVTEDLKPGVTDILTFSVVNPHPVPETIHLVVINTCPGWTASVTPTGIINADPGIMYTSTLRVTPPDPAVLGTGCHIDVQGWIGTELIGGIRKLDVPPVNLPHSDPPWLEQEISTIPTPPISGTLNQACIQLQNPLGFARVVTVTFREAVFGAGIPFTPINPTATFTFTLPPYSLQKYCVPWMPIASANLHHCLQVTLQQPGWQNQTSQRNVDLVRRRLIGWDPSGVHVPFSIGNPFPFTSTLKLNGILIGLNHWKPKFFPDPPPDLAPDQIWNGELQLAPMMQQNGPNADAEPSISGDAVRADVSLSLNDEPYSGFSVDFAPPLNVYLPLILK